MITEAEGQRAFPSLTAQKTASFSLGFRPKSQDGLKLALCEVHKALPKDAKLIATVHDEIIVEAPEAQAEQVRKLLEKIMVSVFDKLFKKQVLIEVDPKICENLGENEGVCDVCAAQIRG